MILSGHVRPSKFYFFIGLMLKIVRTTKPNLGQAPDQLITRLDRVYNYEQKTGHDAIS